MRVRCQAPRWALLLLIGIATTSAAAERPLAPPAAHHTFWVVQGRYNSVYFLGSVHMLKRADSALPPEALLAYRHSKALVMELDLSQIDSGALGGDLSATQLPAGQTLPAVLGPELYARFEQQADHVGLDATLVQGVQPWFAATMLQAAGLAQSGFDAGSGVDEQFAERARTDQKPIIGLETLSEQLSYFTRLTLEQQRDYLRAALEDASEDERETEAVVQAWQRGDTGALERLLREGSKESPELYRALTSERNHKWLPRLDALLGEHDDYLVVVGALHLVGRDGLIELLRAQGYAVTQH